MEFRYGVIALAMLIFIARTFDVLIETVRLLLTVDGHKITASLMAFVEVLVWVWVFNEILLTHRNMPCYFAYAGGYALGTYLGIILGNGIRGRIAKESKDK